MAMDHRITLTCVVKNDFVKDDDYNAIVIKQQAIIIYHTSLIIQSVIYFKRIFFNNHPPREKRTERLFQTKYPKIRYILLRISSRRVLYFTPPSDDGIKMSLILRIHEQGMSVWMVKLRHICQTMCIRSNATMG